MLTEFNKGGSHEQNKYGGIPLGKTKDGNLNTVEEGETKKDNYIYSDRLYINEDLIKEMNLPNYIKGKSFANASKSISDKFKDRNDIHSKQTQKELLERLTNAQEILKSQQDQINNSMLLNQNDLSNQQFADGGFMDFMNQNGSQIGQLGSSLSAMINPNGTFGNQINKLSNQGFEDNHLQKVNQYGQITDSISGNVAKAFGPVGEAIFGAKKFGEGIGSTIGGDAGMAISSVFSPEKTGMSNLLDKNLNIGQKALGMLPGVGGVIAKKSSDKRFKEFQKDKLRSDNFYKYQFNENNNDVKVFANGGFLGDPPTKINKDALLNYNVSPNNSNSLTSRYLDIVGMQKGINHPKLGSGAYFYSGKTPLDPGFDPVVNREFIKQDAIQNYLNSEQGKKYQNALKSQIELEQSQGLPVYSYSYLKPTQYANGGEIQYPKNEIDTYLNEQRPFPYFDNNYNKTMNPNYSEALNLQPKGLNIKADPNIKLYNKGSINKQNESNILNKFNFSDMLRYSPILGNIVQKNNIGAVEVDKAIKNPYQYQKQILDEKSYLNPIQDTSNTSIEALNKSGLTGNQLAASILGSQLNRTKAISDAAMQANLHNINENKLAEQVKQQIESDYTNDLRYTRETNAQNRANRDTQRSKFDAEIYNSLGEIGKENLFKQMAGKMTGYDWLGNYIKDNPDASKEQVIKAYTEELNKKQNQKKYGGFMNLKFKKY